MNSEQARVAGDIKDTAAYPLVRLSGERVDPTTSNLPRGQSISANKAETRQKNTYLEVEP